MEYYELPAAPPTAMFEKMMAADNMRVPFSTSGPGGGGGGYRPMPIPVFSAHAKTVASLDRAPMPQPGPAELARRAFIPSLSGMNLSPISLQGIGQHQMLNESGSSLLGDGATEKSKRNGREGGGGRGSRGGGTSGRKRSRGGQMTDSVTTGSVMDGSLSGGGGAQSTGRAAAASAARQPNSSNGDKAEKSTGRRQSGQGNKRGEKKQPLPVTPSLSDNPCTIYNGNMHVARAEEVTGVANGWTSGVLDIYGLRTRPTNINQYMVDIPLHELMKDSYEAPKLVQKEYEDPQKIEDEMTLDQKINGILQLFPVRPSNGEAAENVGMKAPKHTKIFLDLESPVPPEFEEGLGRQDRAEICADEDMRVGSHMGAVASEPTQSGTSFKIDSLPLHPFEDFLTRLNLGPSDSLQSLISQAQTRADTDLNVNNDTRMDSAVVDRCHRNGSIPPLPCSYPPVGPVKPEQCRWNPRMWCLEVPKVPAAAEKCKAGSSVGDVAIEEEDVSPESPNSRRRKVESKTPESMQPCVPPSDPFSTPAAVLSSPDTADCTALVKEEPRQVENAMVLSSEGAPNPMEVDSCRIDNGAMAVTVTDRPETACSKQVETVECDQRRTGGEAVRPLETPATLAGPQEMDISDRQSKPVADVKQEAGELDVKDTVERKGETKPGQIVLKEEPSVALPSLDLRVVCPSPARNECQSVLSAVPLSPTVTTAAQTLVSFRDSFQQVEPEKTDRERERRRVFQPYQGAPSQKPPKSIRVSSNSHGSGDGLKEGRTNADGGSVPPSKALVSERRKSLSQIDLPEKPSNASPRNANGAGVSTSSRGGPHTAARTSNLSLKMEKAASLKMEKAASKESAKDSSNNKDAAARTLSSLPPLSSGLTSSKGAHKGAKTNGFIPSSNPKGGSAATTNFAKVPTACNTQRVVSGGPRSSSRPAHTTTPASHGTAPVPAKSSRQSIPDGRQKGKTDGSTRGAKSSRD